MTESLIATLAGFVITGLVQFLTAWLKGDKSESTLKREGADEANAAANREASDAQSRMSAANAQPRSRSIVSSRLRGGSA